ncbi:SPW repeat protein [Actinoplanes sp. NBC_00393]
MITASRWDRGAVGGFGAAWNDVVVGAALFVLASFQVLLRWRTSMLGLVAILLGFWLIAAPVLLGYGGGTGTPAATWNSFVVGAVVAVLATFTVPEAG